MLFSIKITYFNTVITIIMPSHIAKATQKDYLCQIEKGK
jgi:hypothetical protein